VRARRQRITDKEDKTEARQMWQKAARVGVVGLEMGIAVAIGFFGGAWLDGRFGTAPYLGLVGLVVGVGAAGKALWDTARKLSRDQTSSEQD
jgi:ATP synthase protein I